MRRIAIALMACVALAGCSLPRGAPLKSEILSQNSEQNAGIQVVELTRANLPNVMSWPTTGRSGGYRWLKGTGGPLAPVIRPGDEVSLSVWDSDPNSLITAPNQKVAQMGKLVVSPAGEIFVPYVGNVVINGLTPNGARELVQERMVQVSQNAQVQLEYRAGSGNTVDLVRGVARPGSIELAGRNVTILSAIANSGGINNGLRNPLVRVLRGGKTYTIRASDLFDNAARNVVLRGGDKIIVEEDGRFFTALGSTGVEKPIYFDREHITAVEATAMTGGLVDLRADPTGILILRDYPQRAVTKDGIKGPLESQVVFVMDITTADGIFAARQFEVNPGDTIMATESPAVALRTLLGLGNTGSLLANRILP